eukprot:2457978-Rhodomonas_salina.10
MSEHTATGSTFTSLEVTQYYDTQASRLQLTEHWQLAVPPGLRRASLLVLVVVLRAVPVVTVTVTAVPRPA